MKGGMRACGRERAGNVADEIYHANNLIAPCGRPRHMRIVVLSCFAVAFASFADVAPASRRGLPVGVFDSGIGGLSVLEQILTVDRFDNATGEEKADGKPDFADERFIYFGDQANMPYGRYAAEGKADFLRELVVRDAQFVLGGADHAPSKIAIIACNTATAYGLECVKALPKEHGEKVIGVVNAGVEGALDVTKDAKAPYAIAVMATPGTITSGVYERTIRTELKARGITVAIDVVNRGGIGLAEAVENDEPGMHDCARTNVVAMVEDYRARGGNKSIKVMILGCTHYPFVLDVIKSTLSNLKKNAKYAPLIADDLVFVDPAVNTAIACYRALKADGLIRSANAPVCRGPRVKAFISVGKNGPLADTVKYGRNVTDGDYGTKIVPLTWDIMPKGAPELIKTKMPRSARELGQRR